MIDVISEYQYHMAWIIYLISGGTFCVFVWRFTRILKHSGWRDLIRVINLAVISIPWYVGDANERVAPAFIVVVMDLSLGNTANGFAASIAILAFIALVLTWLLLKRALRGDHDD